LVARLTRAAFGSRNHREVPRLLAPGSTAPAGQRDTGGERRRGAQSVDLPGHTQRPRVRTRSCGHSSCSFFRYKPGLVEGEAEGAEDSSRMHLPCPCGGSDIGHPTARCRYTQTDRTNIANRRGSRRSLPRCSKHHHGDSPHGHPLSSQRHLEWLSPHRHLARFRVTARFRRVSVTVGLSHARRVGAGGVWGL
jgi:hypothetical protein